MKTKESPKFTLDFEKPIRVLEDQLQQLRQSSLDNQVDLTAEIEAIERKLETTRASVHSSLTPWQKIQMARHPSRPYFLDYVGLLFNDFRELHGDRQFRDDAAIVGGTAFFRGQPVMLLGQQKGRNTRENLRRNFGCPNPEGYRKALRLMRLAEKFELPLLCFVDTPGAYPGIGSEERHVAEAIAVNIREMSSLRTRSLSVVIGEGGSGGALGIAVTDRVLMLQNAYYSVISPEGCAAILWKDRAMAPQAAEALKITADKLLEMGIVDEVVGEPIGGAHTDVKAAAEFLGRTLERNLEDLGKYPIDELLGSRYDRYRALGDFEDVSIHA